MKVTGPTRYFYTAYRYPYMILEILSYETKDSNNSFHTEKILAKYEQCEKRLVFNLNKIGYASKQERRPLRKKVKVLRRKIEEIEVEYAEHFI